MLLRRRMSTLAPAASLQRLLDTLDKAAPPRILLTHGSAAHSGPLRSVAVLDSSFNPPTVAHQFLLETVADRFGVEQKLLLLASVNADKAVHGATLPQRLQMMQLLAQDDRSSRTLCAATAHPLFVDKAAALRAACADDARVLVICGYDTWIRIADPKYYEQSGGVSRALSRLFELVEVVVASRAPASGGGAPQPSLEEQAAAVAAQPQALTNGRLHFLPNDADMAPLSSSAVRAALAQRDDAAASAIVPGCLREFIDASRLYRRSGDGEG